MNSRISLTPDREREASTMNRRVCWSICGLVLLIATPASITAKPSHNPVVLDAKGNVRSFYGIPVTLTRAGLKRLPYRIKVRDEPGGEGGPYRLYVITAQGGVRVEVTFEDDGKLYGADIQTPRAIALKGLGVGSTLADLKAAWPDGDFMFGFEDGYFVTFVTGTNVIFRFNPDDMPPGAFRHDRPKDFPVPETIKVQTIFLYPKPIPLFERAAPIDPNKNSMTVESGKDHRMTARLEVEQTPGSPFVRLTWTGEGTARIEQAIDVSNYPDFDIWSRYLVHDSDPVVVLFRYGNFKDCGLKDDDRDQMYVTLDKDKTTLSPRPPEGVKLDEVRPFAKYMGGGTINSVTHGCRLTFDPKTGASRLEKVE
jgi:hypothetical protein